MNYGKRNIATGLIYMALFMAYGFGLIYMRDFSGIKTDWVANSLDGTHFEATMAHVHGNLFALLNIVFGFLLMYLNIEEKKAKVISWSLLLGLLMPLGIVSEFTLGLPPVLVLLGAVSMIFGTFYFGLTVMKSK